MLQRSLELLDLTRHELVVTILREHEEQINATCGIRAALGSATEVVVLDEPTRSQSQTVAETLRRLHHDGPFLVKDSDNQFSLGELEQPHNYVAVDSLNAHDSINPQNKSYVQVDSQQRIINIREKEVMSDLFSVGGYAFQAGREFLHYYDELGRDAPPWHMELYLSDVISRMILDGRTFHARRVEHYRDWGTVSEWRNELERRQTLLVSLDGLLLERGSRHFRPRYEDVTPNPQAVEAVQHALADGDTVIALSIRPAALEELTRKQLAAVGLPDLRVIYGLPIGTWRLLTSREVSLPVDSGEAHEIAPDDPYLEARLLRRR
jgi:dTDP-glucose pyrophosphorylase